MRTLPFLLGALLAGAAPCQSNLVSVSGRVLDDKGRPVASATVSQYWAFESQPRAHGGSNGSQVYRTDAEGRFAGKFTVQLKAFALMVLSADEKLAALYESDKVEKIDDFELRLQPAVLVKGRFTSTELGHAPTWANIYLNSPGKDSRFGSCSTREGTFQMVLPPGPVKIHAYGTDAADLRKTWEIPAGQPVLDLGDVDLKATFFARHVGKELPPWKVTDVRGLEPEHCALTDLKGKWVYVEFWGWWCGPCVGRGLPEMMKFAEEHKEFADRFQFIAYHDRRAKDFAELDEKLVSIKAQRWGGKDLPFPILLDNTGKTIAEYGIRSFPTGILIDPTGKLVGETGLKTLLAMLEAERNPFRYFRF